MWYRQRFTFLLLLCTLLSLWAFFFSSHLSFPLGHLSSSWLLPFVFVLFLSSHCSLLFDITHPACTSHPISPSLTPNLFLLLSSLHLFILLPLLPSLPFTHPSSHHSDFCVLLSFTASHLFLITCSQRVWLAERLKCHWHARVDALTDAQTHTHITSCVHASTYFFGFLFLSSCRLTEPLFLSFFLFISSFFFYFLFLCLHYLWTCRHWMW